MNSKNKVETPTIRKRKTQQFLKKVGSTLVVPLFLMIVGAVMTLIPLWELVGQAATWGSVLFNEVSVEVPKAEFLINDATVYRPDLGEQFATLHIPALELSHPVYQGDGDAQLRLGVGHYVGSLLPGEGGNVVLSGHRETVFFDLKDIEVGDTISMEVAYGTYEYQVREIYITTPDDVGPTQPTGVEQLTLYTCYPFTMWGPTPERYIVVADFVGLE